MHYRWLENHITKNRVNAIWVIRETIYKHTLKLTTKAWWSVVRHQIAHTANGNILGVTNKDQIVDFIFKLDLNIQWIIREAIRDKVI